MLFTFTLTRSSEDNLEVSVLSLIKELGGGGGYDMFVIMNSFKMTHRLIEFDRQLL